MIPAHRLKRMKRALRREVRALRDGLPRQERRRKDVAIADRLLDLRELQGARTVMAFASFGSEVGTAAILERLDAAGIRIALPRVVQGEIVPVAFRPGDEVGASDLGAPEPVGGEVVSDAEIDVVVTPGLAFDRQGFRTGYGGGYYDRFFRRVRAEAFRVGVCYEIQLVAEVPRGAVDLPVDAVVTERRVIRVGERFER